MNMIGQFGVGFYSSYLVADSVTVASHRAGDQQYLWQSSANDNFFVSEDPRGATLTRGSRVSLHLKDDADEFLQDDKLKVFVLYLCSLLSPPPIVCYDSFPRLIDAVIVWLFGFAST